MSRPMKSVVSPLSGASVEMKTAQVRPIRTSQEVLERARLERELGERRRGNHQHRGAEQAADGREDEAGAERELGLAFWAIA